MHDQHSCFPLLDGISFRAISLIHLEKRGKVDFQASSLERVLRSIASDQEQCPLSNKAHSNPKEFNGFHFNITRPSSAVVGSKAHSLDVWMRKVAEEAGRGGEVEKGGATRDASDQSGRSGQ